MDYRFFFSAGLLLATAGAGCSSLRAGAVEPHQRAYLADRIMRIDADRSEAAARQHVLTLREGAIGGSGPAGGGCGCN